MHVQYLLIMISLYVCRSIFLSTRTLLVLIIIIVLLAWLWPSHHILVVVQYLPSKGGVINSQSSDAVPPAHSLLQVYSDEDDLVDILGNLTFKNYGVVKSSDLYMWHVMPCLYLESQNVSGPYVGWADTGHCNYLYHDVSGDLIHPPSGMRSSVPLGGEVSLCMCSPPHAVLYCMWMC